MSTIAELMVKISGDTSAFNNAMQKAQVGSTALLAGVAVVGAGIAAFGVKSVIAAGQLEATTTAFATMLGSADKATKLLKELQTFAATTPFEFTEIQGAAKSLLAFGVKAEDVTETLRRLGDVSSGVGAPINEIAQLYGKAKTQGRLFAEDINQLTGRGIPIIKELAAQFSVGENEVRGLVESGKIGFPQLELAFKNMTAEGSQFGGMMDAQSKTLPGMWSNLMDAIGQSSVVFGQELIKTFDLKEKLAGVIDGLSKITALLQSEGLVGALEKIFPEKTRIVIAAITGAIVFGLLPALGGLAGAIWLALAPLLPFIAAGAAIAALAYLIYTNWDGISAFFVGIWESIMVVVRKVWDYIGPTIMNGVKIISDYWNLVWPKIQEVFSAVWETMKVILPPIITFIDMYIRNAITGLQVVWGIVWNAIKDTLKLTWDLIIGIIKTSWDIISGLFNTSLDIITGVFKIFKDLFTGNWGALWGDVKTLFSNVWNDIGGTFTNVASDIGNIFKNLATDALDWGKNIITGLWGGIVSASKWLMDKVGAFVQGIKNAFTGKAAFDVESPSKWAEGIGGFIGQGFGNGIQSSLQKVRGQLESQIGGLKGGFSISSNPSISGEAQTGGTAATTNIYIQAVAQTPAAIASAVKRSQQELAFGMG